MNAASAEAVPPASFIGEIVPFEDNGLFELITEAEPDPSIPYRLLYRLRGIDISGSALAEIAQNRLFNCSERGIVQTSVRGVVTIVSCRSRDFSDLTIELLENNLGTAICSEIDVYPDHCPRSN